MKYVKMIGLAAVAAMALMAFAGAGTASAAATTLCKTAESPCSEAWSYPDGTTVHATQKGSGSLATSGFTVTCTESTLHGATAGGGTKIVIDKLIWEGCNTTVDTVATGEIEVTKASSGNATVVAKNTKVTINIAGVSCTFGAGAGLTLGTYTESTKHLTISGTEVPKVEGSFLCPSSGKWTDTYVITQPTGTVYVS
jgi:hypothetical protein